jgi:outer membrane protein assembly factor BamB
VAALQETTAAGLIHRDLKPSNVLLTRDRPKVIDFGLVHLAELPHSQWSHELRVGTVQYMPPEVLRAGLYQGTVAGDIFMLAGTLVYAATGHPPFQPSPKQRLASSAGADLSGLPLSLTPILNRCLSENPAERPGLGTLAAEFARQTPAVRTLADVLSPASLRLLDVFRYELDEALNACAREAAWDERTVSPRPRTGRVTNRHPQKDRPVAYTRPDEPTREYQPTREYSQSGSLVTDNEHVTVPEGSPRPRQLIIEPIQLDRTGSWETRNSWQSVRWACQFGAWIQAPVTVASRVAVAVDLDGTIGGLEALDGSQLWAFGLKTAVRSAAVPLPGPRNEVCLGDADGVVHAFELRSGRRRTLLSAGGAIHGPMAVDDGRIYAVSADGRLYVIDPTVPEHRVLYSTRDLATCGPAVQVGLAYVVTTQGEVVAVDTISESVRWTVPTGGRVSAPPLPVHDRLYVAGSDGVVQYVDSRGEVRATADVGAPVHTRLCHDGQHLYVGASDGTVSAFSLDRRRGPGLTPVWQSPLSGEITGLEAVGGHLYASAGDSVLKLDPRSGAHSVAFQMDGPVAAGPAAAPGLLYVAGLGGTVCCVSLS